MTLTQLLPLLLLSMWISGMMIGFDIARRRYKNPSDESQKGNQSSQCGDQQPPESNPVPRMPIDELVSGH